MHWTTANQQRHASGLHGDGALIDSLELACFEDHWAMGVLF